MSILITVHQLYFKIAYRTVRREVLCNILVEVGVPMKLVRLIKTCLNEIFRNVRTGKQLFDTFLIQKLLK
jgi:anti-sigma regulatory factor (Ser/Thr protein kinase)